MGRKLCETNRKIFESTRGPEQGYEQHHAEKQEHGVSIHGGNGFLLAVEACGFTGYNHRNCARQSGNTPVKSLAGKSVRRQRQGWSLPLPYG